MTPSGGQSKAPTADGAMVGGPSAARPTRLCPICTTPLVKRINETQTRFAKHVCCSRDCYDRYFHRKAQKARGRVQETKKCIICGTIYPRKEDERTGNWNNRKSCGAKPCVRAVRRLLGQYDKKADDSMSNVPANDGLPANAFANNVVPKDGGVYRRLTRPDTRTYGGVAG